MTDTVLSSATREVVIGFERPFVIIGERINPTGRKKLAAEMADRDFSTVTVDALAQVDAGAHMLAVTYSDFVGFGAGSGTGNIDTDPLWVDAGSNDYHLLPASPCIDTLNLKSDSGE